MSKTRPTVRRPVVLKGLSSRRRTIHPRDAVLGADALDTPMPGQLLILLSRLSRSEGATVAATDDEVTCAGPRGA